MFLFLFFMLDVSALSVTDEKVLMSKSKQLGRSVNYDVHHHHHFATHDEKSDKMAVVVLGLQGMRQICAMR